MLSSHWSRVNEEHHLEITRFFRTVDRCATLFIFDADVRIKFQKILDDEVIPTP